MLKKMILENKEKLQKKIYHHLPLKQLQNTGLIYILRVDQYMPDDNIGLPKPYGMYKPFKPTPLGSNLRHIKKPQPKNIEI